MDAERLVANYILRPIVQVVKIVLWPVWGPLGLILARTDESRLKNDVRADLPFLFVQYRGRFVRNRDVPYIPSFDYAFATVAAAGILLRFSRGRGELDIRIASANAPQDWYDLPDVFAALNQNGLPEIRRVRSMQDAARLLESTIGLIAAAFTESDPDFFKRLANARIDERIQIKEAEWQLNKRL